MDNATPPAVRRRDLARAERMLQVARRDLAVARVQRPGAGHAAQEAAVVRAEGLVAFYRTALGRSGAAVRRQE